MSKKSTLAAFIALFALIYFSIKVRKDERDSIKARNYPTIGTISSVGWKTVDITYSVNGVSYTSTKKIPYRDIVVGESFLTLVSKENHSRILVNYDEPILDTASILYNTTSVTSYNNLSFNSIEASFSYVVGDQTIDRIMMYPEGKRPDNSKSLIVKYRADNPEIGYLFHK